ncbi:MAG: AlkZ family DNA glycosylase [Chloroflexi bacterium]|nr:AlkZ family DNA glycosylase [Chloroflexota bacterium]
MPRKLTWAEVWRRRLRRHHLLEPTPRDRMLDVVGQVCAIHAQIATSAELSLGLRVRDIAREDVSRALWQDRTLVKTYGLRGTLHIFPAHEFGLWTAALRAKVPPRGPSANELEAVPADRRDQLIETLCAALDGGPLTRDELEAEIAQRLGPWVTEAAFPAFGGQWPRWQLGLHQAALAGLVVAGPPRGNRVTYVRTVDWLGPVQHVDGQIALREVCRRFLDAYGPATPAEFARWFYTRPAAARELMHSLDLEEVDVEGWQAWLPRGAVLDAPGRQPSAHLLPQFDCYVVGGFPRDRLIPAAAPVPLQRGTAAPFAVVLIDGVVAGLWERRRRGTVLEARIHTFERINRSQRRALEQQAERVAEILQLRAEVEFGRVEPRHHL